MHMQVAGALWETDMVSGVAAPGRMHCTYKPNHLRASFVPDEIEANGTHSHSVLEHLCFLL